jgi:putative Holliday junction resolvase
MRTLAIDLGSKRVGLALSDEGGTLATPYDVIEVSSPSNAVDQITPIVMLEGVRRVVVGLPLNMDGTIGSAARSAIHWGTELSTRCGQPVVFVDERLSSFEADQELVDRKRAGEKLTRRQKRQQLDALAAAGFLQAFLDGKLPAIQVT